MHRVQRVPATETQGRIHTSAATVAVLPEAEEVDVKIEPQDLKIDVFRSSGPGGQSVNTTDSAVRITHLPTGAGGEPAGPEIPASEQDQGDGGAAGPAARPDDRRAGGGALPRAAGDGGHRRPLGQDPDLQLSPEPGHRSPDQSVGPQPGRRAQRRPGRAGRCAADGEPSGAGCVPELAHQPARAAGRAPRPRCARPGCASPPGGAPALGRDRRRALGEALVLDPERGRGSADAAPSAASWSAGAPRASRSPTWSGGRAFAG